MRLLDLTLPTPAENLALDEALLERAEQRADGETLRIWEAPAPMVVLGRSSKLDVEVDRQACRRLGVPIVRRTSGGASVVAGPGCLMYAVTLRYQGREGLHLIDRAHQFVLGTIAAALARRLDDVKHQGISDLTWQCRKFSGNSLRCKHAALLYHGTLLYDFPLATISQLLRAAPRQPAYRAGRNHDEFVANIPLPRGVLYDALREAWQPTSPLADWPAARTATLAAEKYAKPEWTARH